MKLFDKLRTLVSSSWRGRRLSAPPRPAEHKIRPSGEDWTLLQPTEISVADYNEARQGAYINLLDCRETMEWKQMHIPGSVNIPMNQTPGRLDLLDKAALVVVYSNDGNRSRTVAQYLMDAGYQVKSLHGGMTAWKRVVGHWRVIIIMIKGLAQRDKWLLGGILGGDLLLLMIVLIFGDGLVADLTATSRPYVLLAMGLYFLFCIGVYGVRKLQAEVGGETSWGSWWGATGTQKMRAVLGGVVAVVFVLALMHQLGYLASLTVVDARRLGEGESVAYLVMAPGAWLAVSLIFALLTGSEFEKTVAVGERRYGILLALGVVMVQGMLLFLGLEAAAVWQLVVGRPWSVLVGVLVGVGLAAVFTPLRGLLLGIGRADGRLNRGLIASLWVVVVVMMGVLG